MSMDGELAGKVAIVTGSARRMGRAIALRLAQSGASIVVNTKTSIEEANAVAHEIEQSGGAAIAVAADITDPASVKAMVESTVARFGRIDILVNNVAIRRKSVLSEISLDEWHEVVHSILDGSFLCSQACAPYLTAAEGTIVNIGGASAHFGSRGHPHVMAAKAGLLGLTRGLALDLAPHVTVNCLVPGRIDAPTDSPHALNAPRAYTFDRIPAGRAGTIEEVAEGVLMLCNPRSRYITGQALHMNGGMFFGS